MPTAEERLAILDEMLTEARDNGLVHLIPDDGPIDGRTLAIDGQTMLNFGSCRLPGP